jgi:hypothetical protein
MRVMVQETLEQPAKTAHDIYTFFKAEFQPQGRLRFSAHVSHHVQTKHQTNIVQLYMFMSGQHVLRTQQEKDFYKALADRFLAWCIN